MYRPVRGEPCAGGGEDHGGPGGAAGAVPLGGLPQHQGAGHRQDVCGDTRHAQVTRGHCEGGDEETCCRYVLTAGHCVDFCSMKIDPDCRRSDPFPQINIKVDTMILYVHSL